MNPKVLEQAQDALLSDRQLEIEYRSLGDAAASWRLVNPRALLLKGSVMYLLADKLGIPNAPERIVKQYALHRIRSRRPGVKSVARSDFNLKMYIEKNEDEVGNRHGIRVRLRITPDLAKILRETSIVGKATNQMSREGIVWWPRFAIRRPYVDGSSGMARRWRLWDRPHCARRFGIRFGLAAAKY